MPVDEPFAAARVVPAEMARWLRLGRAGKVGRQYNPRWPGDGRTPTIHTQKPGAFRDRWDN